MGGEVRGGDLGDVVVDCVEAGSVGCEEILD